MEDTFTQAQVLQAVIKATQSGQENITVEPLNSSSRDYAMSYRIKVNALRADLNLIDADMWPSGMVVSRWIGQWYTLKQSRRSPIFCRGQIFAYDLARLRRARCCSKKQARFARLFFLALAAAHKNGALRAPF